MRVNPSRASFRVLVYSTSDEYGVVPPTRVGRMNWTFVTPELRGLDRDLCVFEKLNCRIPGPGVVNDAVVVFVLGSYPAPTGSVFPYCTFPTLKLPPIP